MAENVECPECGDWRHEVGATTAERVCACGHHFTVHGGCCPIPTQEYDDDFLDHVVRAPSQYDRTCRVLAAEVIRLRRETAHKCLELDIIRDTVVFLVPDPDVLTVEERECKVASARTSDIVTDLAKHYRIAISTIESMRSALRSKDA